MSQKIDSTPTSLEGSLLRTAVVAAAEAQQSGAHESIRDTIRRKSSQPFAAHYNVADIYQESLGLGKRKHSSFNPLKFRAYKTSVDVDALCNELIDFAGNILADSRYHRSSLMTTSDAEEDEVEALARLRLRRASQGQSISSSDLALQSWSSNPAGEASASSSPVHAKEESAATFGFARSGSRAPDSPRTLRRVVSLAVPPDADAAGNSSVRDSRGGNIGLGASFSVKSVGQSALEDPHHLLRKERNKMLLEGLRNGDFNADFIRAVQEINSVEAAVDSIRQYYDDGRDKVHKEAVALRRALQTGHMGRTDLRDGTAASVSSATRPSSGGRAATRSSAVRFEGDDDLTARPSTPPSGAADRRSILQRVLEHRRNSEIRRLNAKAEETPADALARRRSMSRLQSLSHVSDEAEGSLLRRKNSMQCPSDQVTISLATLSSRWGRVSPSASAAAASTPRAPGGGGAGKPLRGDGVPDLLPTPPDVGMMFFSNSQRRVLTTRDVLCSNARYFGTISYVYFFPAATSPQPPPSLGLQTSVSVAATPASPRRRGEGDQCSGASEISIDFSLTGEANQSISESLCSPKKKHRHNGNEAGLGKKDRSRRYVTEEVLTAIATSLVDHDPALRPLHEGGSATDFATRSDSNERRAMVHKAHNLMFPIVHQKVRLMLLATNGADPPRGSSGIIFFSSLSKFGLNSAEFFEACGQNVLCRWRPVVKTETPSAQSNRSSLEEARMSAAHHLYPKFHASPTEDGCRLTGESPSRGRVSTSRGPTPQFEGWLSADGRALTSSSRSEAHELSRTQMHKQSIATSTSTCSRFAGDGPYVVVKGLEDHVERLQRDRKSLAQFPPSSSRAFDGVLQTEEDSSGLPLDEARLLEAHQQRARSLVPARALRNQLAVVEDLEEFPPDGLDVAPGVRRDHIPRRFEHLPARPAGFRVTDALHRSAQGSRRTVTQASATFSLRSLLTRESPSGRAVHTLQPFPEFTRLLNKSVTNRERVLPLLFIPAPPPCSGSNSTRPSTEAALRGCRSPHDTNSSSSLPHIEQKEKLVYGSGSSAPLAATAMLPTSSVRDSPPLPTPVLVQLDGDGVLCARRLVPSRNAARPAQRLSDL